MFELVVGLEDGVGVDGDLRHDLLDRRQLVAYLELTQAQRMLDLLGKLQIGDEPGFAVEVKRDHRPSLSYSHTIM